MLNIYIDGMQPKNSIQVLSRGKVQSTLTLNDWARYVNKINRQDWT